jgi:hypothetical protein
MESHKREVEGIDGWEMLLTVYDELVASAPIDYPDAAQAMEHIMSKSPAWLPEMPVRGEVFEANRYRKE